MTRPHTLTTTRRHPLLRHLGYRAPALLVLGACLAWQGLGGLTAPAQAAQPALLAAASGAATSAAADAQIDAALTLFQRAAQGDESAIEPAADALANLLAAHPTDLVLLANAGSSHAMLARTTMLPWKKMRYADDGLAQLDKALAQLSPALDAPGHRGVPAVLDIKLVAANTFLALPSLFNRGERGAKLLREVMASPLLASSPAPFRESVARAQAKYAKQLGQ